MKYFNKKRPTSDEYNYITNKIDEDLYEGYAITFETIIHYLDIMIRSKENDKAYNLACKMIPTIKNTKYAEILAYTFLHLKKYDDIFNLFPDGPKSDDEKILFAKVYLICGEINKCEKICNDLLNTSTNEFILNEAKKINVKINNNKIYNSFIPIDYDIFLKKVIN